MRVAHLSEIEAVPVEEAGIVWKPVRRELGVEAFGINAYVAARAGDRVVEEHDEAMNAHQEVYLVVTGRATFTVDGKEVDAPAGTFVFLDDPAEQREAVAAEAGTTVLAIGGPVRKPFEVSGWEFVFAAYPLARAGDLEGAIALVDEGLARRPGHPGLLYRRACFEAHAGRTEEAFADLTTAVAAEPRLRTFAAEEDDLAPLRSDPRFPPSAA